MAYIDAFIAAVPTANKETYLKHAQDSVPVFKKYGALRILENWGSDIPAGEVTSLPLAVKAREDETVVISMAFWPSKEVRDEAWAKMMEDPFFKDGPPQPFDGKRMIFGGFDTILDE